nr:helix-turn-helix transcriptional regulator [Methyloferula stellata]
MSITPEQCRAGRALLGWSQDDLVEASKVTKSTIANFESGKREPYERTLTDLRRALEEAGVIFIDRNGNGPGVRLKDRG